MFEILKRSEVDFAQKKVSSCSQVIGKDYLDQASEQKKEVDLTFKWRKKKQRWRHFSLFHDKSWCYEYYNRHQHVHFICHLIFHSRFGHHITSSSHIGQLVKKIIVGIFFQVFIVPERERVVGHQQHAGINGRTKKMKTSQETIIFLIALLFEFYDCGSITSKKIWRSVSCFKHKHPSNAPHYKNKYETISLSSLRLLFFMYLSI